MARRSIPKFGFPKMLDLLLLVVLASSATAVSAEDWLQMKYDCRHSGDAPARDVSAQLGLVGAVALTDAVFTAPVVSEGRVYVVDGGGVAYCLDASTLEVLWKVATRGGTLNCNNVSSPAIVGSYLHFGTMAGSYYVLDTTSGKVVKEIACGEPIFSAPVVGNGRVYFATLGSRIHAIEPDGTICWTWDFVKQRMGFSGNRWSGKDWLKHKGKRVTYDDQFCCSRDIVLCGKMLVVPAGASLVWLEDMGDRPNFRATYQSRATYDGGDHYPSRVTTLGLSVGETGNVYRQTHRIDNGGEVEQLRLVDGKVRVSDVPGTTTSASLPGSLSFCSVSLRGNDVYRCRPEEGFGFCKHTGSSKPVRYAGSYPSIAAPILLHDTAIYGGLDGILYIVPLSGTGKVQSFHTAFGKAISAPVAVCDGRVFFGCEDGYLYVLGPAGKAPLPSKDLGLERIRSPLKTKFSDPKYDWFTSFGDWGNTNTNHQDLAPPFKIRWIRRYKGTIKHFSTYGGGRMYTHTAEGQIFAVEQDTGRLLWRRYFPGVHISYTTPLYYKGRLLVPQAGFRKCRLRCLDAATGKLLWEAPFSGSPSWNRQLPPIVHKNLAIYIFSTGKYAPRRSDDRMDWLFGHGQINSFPRNQKALVRAYDLDTGKEVWTRDFSKYGYGGDDAGLCLMGDTLYYSCYFGGSAKRIGKEASAGITAAIEPLTGRVVWLTTKYSVHSGCTISGKDGRLYLGGYAPVSQHHRSCVWCLDARDGSLVWQSAPLIQSIQAVTIGSKSCFTCSQADDGFLYFLNKDTGKILTTVDKPYMCARYTLSEPYLLGPNMDIFDTSNKRFISSGPAIDPNACVGAVVSNGRLFHTSQGGGLQLSMVYGTEGMSGTSGTVEPKILDRAGSEATEREQ